MAGEGAAAGLTQVAGTDLVRNGPAAINKLGDELVQRGGARPALIVGGPGGTVNTSASTSMTLWFTIGNVTVPAGAISARVRLSIVSLNASSVSAINVNMAIRIGGVAGTVVRIPGSGASQLIPLSYVDQIIAPVAGVQSVALYTAFVTGTGTYQLPAGAVVTAEIEFLFV